MKEKCAAHTHVNEHGKLITCYHECKNVLKQPAFWIGATISFPLEHFIWTKIPFFSHISEFLGLIH